MRIVLIASTLAVLAATASAKNTASAAVGQKGKKHAGARKHRALRQAGGAAAAGQQKKAAIPAEDVQLAAEDEGYWDRFLQAEENSLPTPAPTPRPTPPPTPAPTPLGECGVDVSFLGFILPGIELSRHVMC